MNLRPTSAGRAESALEERIAAADALLREQVAGGSAESAALLVQQRAMRYVRHYGAAAPEQPFLIASLTKPMTAAAVLRLCDLGELRLADPVTRYLPEFRGAGREEVALRHLLTHTSGLPDMLPENVALRRRHASIDEFVAGACRASLRFAPGTRVAYQSMGILLAAAVVERVSGSALRDFLHEQFFLRLRMADTSLGLGGRRVEAMVRCQVSEPPTDWDWNSPYWRDFGAPWGGVHSTVQDLARFFAQFTGADSPLRTETLRAMTAVQTSGLNEAWGLGWARQPGTFGRACSPLAFGHFGNTGTIGWHDPEHSLTCLLLTSVPATDSRAGLLGAVSDIIAGDPRPNSP
ncbi:MAG: beta-lactamase family protein [Opitutaceae bacterium]|nr:beta-lactamase family protein [Opitutaceae bacterium]